MKDILIQQKVFKVISGMYSTDDTYSTKAELNELANSDIILNMSESVLRNVGEIDLDK